MAHNRPTRSTRYRMPPPPVSTTLQVRQATATDVDALVRLMRAFYAEAGFALDAAWAASSLNALLSGSAPGGIWLATQDGEPVGHAVLTLRHSMEHGGWCGHIDDLFVAPAFRRRGAARLMLAAMFSACEARGCKALYVEVGQSNTAARALYAGFGLQPPGDDRLVLGTTLPRAGGARPG